MGFSDASIQRGFHHRFSSPLHPPVGMNPAAYGVDHDALGQGRRKAIDNDMHGPCVENDVHRCFDHL